MKRILSALLAVSLTASLMLSGCAETPTPTTTAPAVTTAPTTVPTTVPPETTAPIETTPPPTTVPVVTKPVETTVPETSAPDDSQLTVEQKNALNILNYLSVIAEEIRVSRNNRLVLEDIYNGLIDEINPGAVDERTQQLLSNLRGYISDFKNIENKRERLIYIHNHDMATAMRNAVPNPLSVLSVSNALDWKRLAISVAYTMVDSYTRYKTAADGADMKYLTSSWELTDYETDTLERSHGNTFDYAVAITHQYESDGYDANELGKLTLNEAAIRNYADYLTTENIHEKIQLLVSERDTYAYFGDYWIELADCYFDVGKYRECLECVQTYYSLDIDFFRKNYNVVRILPKAIVAVQDVYANDKDSYTYYSKLYADEIIQNTDFDAWSLRYFAAQVYLDLYQREPKSSSHKKEYLNQAYEIVKNNVAHLIKEQRNLNAVYENDIVKLSTKKSDYKDYDYMTDKEFEAEKKRIEAYNKELENNRKTELPSLYEPLLLNCDLLFALADKKGISDTEKADINNSLNGVFLTQPISNTYLFDAESIDYSLEYPITLKKDKMIIPVELLTSETTFTVTVATDSGTSTFSDWKVSEVERKGKTTSSFYAHLTSNLMSNYKWSVGAKVKIQINNGANYPLVEYNFTVTEYKDNWPVFDLLFPDTITFE